MKTTSADRGRSGSRQVRSLPRRNENFRVLSPIIRTYLVRSLPRRNENSPIRRRLQGPWPSEAYLEGMKTRALSAETRSGVVPSEAYLEGMKTGTSCTYISASGLVRSLPRRNENVLHPPHKVPLVRRPKPTSKE